MSVNTSTFIGSVPRNYQQYLVPFMFEGYAKELAARVTVPRNGAVLEMACGTGVVTSHLRSSLPRSVRLVASDLNPEMLRTAKSLLDGVEGIDYEVADGTELPFEDATFDAIVCQFGVMFFPDKAKGFSESYRVLKPGGCLLFNVWDTLEANPVTQLIHEAVVGLSPRNPATFLTRPHSYCDPTEISAALETAGFQCVNHLVKPREAVAPSAWHIVMGMVVGGPLAGELEERGLTKKARNSVEAVLREVYGGSEIRARLQAILVEAKKPD